MVVTDKDVPDKVMNALGKPLWKPLRDALSKLNRKHRGLELEGAQQQQGRSEKGSEGLESSSAERMEDDHVPVSDDARFPAAPKMERCSSIALYT